MDMLDNLWCSWLGDILDWLVNCLNWNRRRHELLGSDLFVGLDDIFHNLSPVFLSEKHDKSNKKTN